MKKCTWCGKEYPDSAQQCAIDGEPLAGGEPPPPKPAARTEEELEQLYRPPAAPAPADANADWRPTLLDLDQTDGAFVFSEGYSRPDWQVIREELGTTVPPERLAEGWSEIAIQWARRVAADLGQAYWVQWSGRFVLLSALDQRAAKQLLAFAEGALDKIHTLLQDAAWKTGLGKHVIFLFTEEDDYYQYVSYFNRDGVHPTSGGCLIHRDYVHVALPYHDGHHTRQALAHELMHNCVVHLRLPLWLNEGLAVTFDRTVAQGRHSILDHELRDRHLAFWNPENIQKFWAGVSFGEPGDSNQLSYSLAEILLNLLLSQSRNFGEFLKHADWHDAGQTAALEALDIDLGQTAATFLGEGNWRPNRKAMAACWDTPKTEQEEAQ